MIFFIEGSKNSEKKELYEKLKERYYKDKKFIFYDIKDLIIEILQLEDPLSNDKFVFNLIKTLLLIELNHLVKNELNIIVLNGFYKLYFESTLSNNDKFQNYLEKIVKSTIYKNINTIFITRDPMTLKKISNGYLVEQKTYNKIFSNCMMWINDIKKKNNYRFFINKCNNESTKQFLLQIKEILMNK